MDRNKKMMGEWEQKSLLNELLRGKELAGQLQLTIATSPPSSSSSSSSTSSSYESRQNLVQNILVSFEKALSMLNWPGGSSGTSNQSLLPAVPVMIGMSESPPSLTGSPFSDDSDRDQDNKDYIGSRKRWTKQVRVSPGMGLEGPLDDGFSWRKYGQKDILGAKYPRGYYRCTHRNVQGCLATKQVQRSDDDPTIFEITYRARHTCTQAPGHVIGTTTTTTSTASTDQNQNNNNFPSLLEQMSHHQTHQDDHHHNSLSSLRSGLKVITEGLENPHDGQSPPLIISSNNFNFPTISSSTPLPVNANMIDAVATATAVVAAAAGEDQNPTAADHGRFSSPNYSMIINHMSLMTEFSHHHHHPPSFVSPETSGTNYFSSSAVSPHHHQHHEFGGSSVQQSFDHHNDQHGSESDQIISAIITSTANTTQPIGMEISGHEFDSNFTFDNSGFFS
ncbi:probable WRKY transcription factor 53 isoform X2 [Cannabis sativa]|uniref:probable WRKY transcription factor 53 isoform X2 n=1 Tax=Cannabis sativa TaxID=3483 RepID=UPI0029C9BF0B|nr:probable WRKY transcription factor 53 isoform X2 [Cannabis sativa]